MKTTFPGIKVISSDQYAGPTRDTAKRAAENLLNRFGSDLQGIFCVNESSTAGTLLALQDIDRAGKIAFIGFDSSQPFIDALRNGQLQGLVVQNPLNMGYLGVMTMVDHLQGKQVERRIDTGRVDDHEGQSRYGAVAGAAETADRSVSGVDVLSFQLSVISYRFIRDGFSVSPFLAVRNLRLRNGLLMTSPGMHPFPRRRFLGVPLVAAASAAMASPGPQRTGDAPDGLRRLRHPGFLDLQVNGFAGVDFNDPATSPDQVHHALAALRGHGVTQILPTIISGPLERYERCARTLLQANAPAILGLHMEGPYISPEDGARGAHRREDTAPASIDDFKRRQEIAGGRVRIVTLAPEVPGALALIEHLRDTGVRVAIGHTAATPEQVRDAVRAGATLSTHLGNGCAQMLPRHPNFLWEQLAADELLASHHRGRAPPAPGDGEVDGPREDAAPRGARHRRDCRRRAAAG